MSSGESMNKDVDIGVGFLELMQGAREIYEMMSAGSAGPAKFCEAMAALATHYEDGYWRFKETESGHEAADELMLAVLESLGYGAGCAIFRSAEKWYA